MRSVTKVLVALAWLLVVPAAAFAQASIAGVVRDTSGAVLPGVTVETASPALIEKTRAVVTDTSGQYKIVDLRPGTYSVTFSLTGFQTVKRENIELTGSFTATVNTDLQVGNLEETITVSTQGPIVDVQGTTQQKVLTSAIIDSIPTGRTHFNIATMIPAVSSNNSADVGGTNSINLTFLVTHGGRANDQRVTVEGLSTNNAEGAGQYSGYFPNTTSTQELTVDYAGGSAEMITGGVRINIVPKDGGNTFKGTGFLSGMGGNFMRGTNNDATLRAQGLAFPTYPQKLVDFNPGVGGPILRDRLWFYASARWQVQDNYAGGYGNANRGDFTKWNYVSNGVPNLNYGLQTSKNGRVTLQANAKNKISYFYDKQYRCLCPTLTAVTAPEVGGGLEYPFADFSTLTWSSPVTNRLLIEAGASYHPERWHSYETRLDPSQQFITDQIGVTDLATSERYRAFTAAQSDTLTVVWNTRASLSYVTGSHAFKVGFTNQHATRDKGETFNPYNLAYTFNNGNPVSIAERSDPNHIQENLKADLGLYAQDKWTVDRLTANVGLRFDYLNIYFPPQTLGPSTYTPTRNFAYPYTPWVSWKDLSPRLGANYDLFGTGKTAVRASLNKYMQSFGLQGVFGDGSNPINLIPSNVTRSWNDNFYPVGDPRRGNFTPDCDLASPLANNECGAMSDKNFGLNIPSASVDPAILRGWGKRGYNWEFSTGVQQQLTPRISVDAAYFKRIYGNFIAVDNLATTAADYTPFTVTAPVNALLPGGGGYTIGGLSNLNPDKFGQINTLYTFASNYGKETEHWDGVDFGVNTRLGQGILLQGGVSAGRTIADNCAVVAASPEIQTGLGVVSSTAQVALVTTPQTTYCHQNSGYLTQVKGFGSYTLPKIDVQTSANFQSYIEYASAGSFLSPTGGLAYAGPAVLALYNVPTAVAAQTLGRPLSGGAATASVNLLAPGQVYGNRVNQTDVKLAKIFKYGRTQTGVTLDLFNVFNRNPVLTENSAYASFRQPLSILQARFAKIGVQFDF